MPETFLHFYIRHHDWDRAYIELERNPNSCTKLNQRGENVLHLACIAQAPLNLIKAIIRNNPACIRQKTKGRRMLPLHYACFGEAKFPVFQLLIGLQPENNNEEDNLMIEGLEPFPEAATMQETESGFTPITLCWHCHLNQRKVFLNMDEDVERERATCNVRNMFSIKCKDDLKGDTLDWFQRLELLVQAAYFRNYGGRAPIQEKWNMVHATAGVNCNPAFMRLVLKVFPEQAQMKDSKDRLPVHIAIRKTCVHKVGPKSIEEFQKEEQHQSFPSNDDSRENHTTTGTVDCHRHHNIEKFESILTPLLESFPKAASISIDNKHTLLFLGIVNGRTWTSGIQEIVEAAPQALCTTDRRSRLYPFQAVATREVDGDLETIFELLRRVPFVLQQALERLERGRQDDFVNNNIHRVEVCSEVLPQHDKLLSQNDETKAKKRQRLTQPLPPQRWSEIHGSSKKRLKRSPRLLNGRIIKVNQTKLLDR